MAITAKFYPVQATVGGVSKQIGILATEKPDSLGGGSSGGTTIQKLYVSVDNGSNLFCTSVPPGDYVLLAAGVQAGGLNYKVGDVFAVAGGTFDYPSQPYQAAVTVSAVNGSGSITAVAVTTPGAYTVAPANTTQPFNSATGAGASILLNFGHPVPVSVLKPYKLTFVPSEYYLGVTYTYSYVQTSADVGHPAGSPGMVYWTRGVAGSDGSAETDAITPPYLWGDPVWAASVGGNLQDLNIDGRCWAALITT